MRASGRISPQYPCEPGKRLGRGRKEAWAARSGAGSLAEEQSPAGEPQLGPCPRLALASPCGRHRKCCSQSRSLHRGEDTAAPAIHHFLQFLPFHPVFLKTILSSSQTAGLPQFASFCMLMKLLERAEQTAFSSWAAWPSLAVSPP